MLWIAAERVVQFQALWPCARLAPELAAHADQVRPDCSRDDALIEIVRGRLEGSGPVTGHALTAALGLESKDIAAALMALQQEGFVLRGQFTPDQSADEWCQRRLLARIHGHTVKRLRAEIEPVAARDFLRFLLAWQRVATDARMEGPRALDAVVGQLEGVFEAPAGAWESGILPARIAGYEPAWLDARCLAGRVAWTRLKPTGVHGSDRRPAPVRTTPIALLLRSHAPIWTSLSAKVQAPHLGTRAQAVANFISAHGASFFDELAEGTGLLRSQVEEALAELVATGLVNYDNFGGLRALLVPSGEHRRPLAGGRRRRRTAMFGMEEAGRWAPVRRPQLQQPGPPAQSIALEPAAGRSWRGRCCSVTALCSGACSSARPTGCRPGESCCASIARSSGAGEIRGGRFVAGFSGEQFALPDAIGMLREVRRQQASGALVSLSGADPLNLAGILTPGPKLAALTGNRLLFRDGLPIALLAGGEVQFLETLDPASEWEARKALLRKTASPPLADVA